MKRLVLVALVGLLVLGLVGGALADIDGGTGTPATASLNVDVSWVVDNWILLYIPNADMNVSLGTVDSSYYHPDTDTWDPVTDGLDHNAYVITNAPGGYTLTVSAASSGPMTADLTRFQIKGGDLTSWTSLDTPQTLKTTSAAAIDHIGNIQYQYLVNETDAPGNYAVTVTYTATTN